MFLKKSEVKKIVLLKNAERYDHKQILKHYLPEYPVGERMKIYKSVVQSGYITNNLMLSDYMFKFVTEYEQEKSKDLPALIYSIVMNSLAFEANEEIKHTVYNDYQDPNVKKYSKNFIEGQYKIFKNSYEPLFYTAEKTLQVLNSDIERIVNLVVEVSLNSKKSVERLERLLLAEKRKFDMIKISEIEAVSQWNTIPIFGFSEETKKSKQVNPVGVKSTVLLLKGFDFLYTEREDK
tara:strand:- start:3697 stop:4404 length:708 start_codon:yes stop_codon:yes gene_type:complete